MKLGPCLLVAVLGSQAAASVSRVDRAQIRAQTFAREMYPRWVAMTFATGAAEVDRVCPRSAYELLRAVDPNACDDEMTDPWGYRFEVLCVRSAPQPFIGVYSVGEDGLAGTADDVKSWSRYRH